MNERQLKKAIVKVKRIGNIQKDTYVQMLNVNDTPNNLNFKRGDVFRLQTNTDGKPFETCDFFVVQNKQHHESELVFRELFGTEKYDAEELFDGELVRREEFKIIWKDGEPV